MAIRLFICLRDQNPESKGSGFFYERISMAGEKEKPAVVDILLAAGFNVI